MAHVCASARHGPEMVAMSADFAAGEMLALTERIRAFRIYLLVAALLAGSSYAEPKREVPDYDGRGNPDSDRESWALWIPRAILWPFYAFHEYLIRRPIGAVMSHAEREHWGNSASSLFAFGPNNKHTLYPIARFDVGLLPSVGAHYNADDLFVDDNTVNLDVATWGKPRIVAAIADRYALDPDDRVEARFAFRRAEDNVFVGIGPDVKAATRSRYGTQNIEGSAAYRRRLFFSESGIEVRGGVHRMSFVDRTCCGDPSVLDRVAVGSLMLPPGYGETYRAGFASLDLTLDSRDSKPGSGAFLHAFTRPSLELGAHRAWGQYGGEVGGSVDLTGHQRILTAQLAARFADALWGGEVPLPELATVDDEIMPGFLPGWLTGGSIAVAQLDYTWPVWSGIDGETRVAVGNAFADHLAGLRVGRLRWSWDFALSTNPARDRGLELRFGLGSETFDQGAEITSVRFAIGTKGL